MPDTPSTAASEAALEKLCQVYRQGMMCVFTGAGVSFTEAAAYKAPGWWGLLLETYAALRLELSSDQAKARFEALRAERPQAWDAASALVSEAGSEAAFLAIMRRVLVGRTGRDKAYKRLPIAYLNHAATLNAVIAFCSRLRAVRIHPCLEPNPRLRAVLTLNYDWFLEGGATQKYNANPFKPVASLESQEEPGRLPVYHLHGYIPHDVNEAPRYPLILTAESYREAYRPGAFTTETLDRFLGAFPALFVGVSFEDELLVRRIEGLSVGPTHFALFKAGSADEMLLDRLRAAGVLPILYPDHDRVPDILGRVYQSGLDAKDLAIPHEGKNGQVIDQVQLTPEEYWAALLFNKL